MRLCFFEVLRVTYIFQLVSPRWLALYDRVAAKTCPQHRFFGGFEANTGATTPQGFEICTSHFVIFKIITVVMRNVEKIRAIFR
mmetsp:Transcript_63821/g.170990  ORF Transcript_63821/g.170990 Transcript_63821/m.170990 type:complete len:84 (+) Transcript_63821:369-620(+)